MKISIVIPVYNEKPTLAVVLQRVLAAPLPAGCTREVIVVDDGSTDGSSAVVEDFRRSGAVVAAFSAVNAGKGCALRAGIEVAGGDVVLVQDGDLEYDPSDYEKLLAPIVAGDADVVYGSRFRGDVSGMRWPNWIANRVLTCAANLLFNARITDEATAYKAFRRPLLRNLRLTCRRFEFCPEVTAKLRRLGYVIREVPISYSARTIAEGKKIRSRDGFHALWTLVKLRLLPRSSFVRRSDPLAAPAAIMTSGFKA